MQTPKWQLALGFFFLALLLAFGYVIASYIFHFLGSLDQPVIIAILAGSVAIFTSTISVVAGRIFERKKEIEAHFRQRKFDQYDELLKILYEFFSYQSQPNPSTESVSRLREWQRKLILFAGPQTIRAFVVWMTNLKSGSPTVKTVFLMEEFFKALRADLGISNRGIEQGLLAHLILRHADLMIAVAKTNPETPLAELAQLEDQLGLNGPFKEEQRPAESAPSPI
jgi:hypothetical protein